MEASLRRMGRSDADASRAGILPRFTVGGALLSSARAWRRDEAEPIGDD